jgi:hypothetical protein
VSTPNLMTNSISLCQVLQRCVQVLQEPWTDQEWTRFRDTGLQILREHALQRGETASDPDTHVHRRSVEHDETPKLLSERNSQGANFPGPQQQLKPKPSHQQSQASSLPMSQSTPSTPKPDLKRQRPSQASRAVTNESGRNYSARSVKRTRPSGSSASSRKRSSGV